MTIECAKEEIRANVVCLGWIDTPMNTPYIANPGSLSKAEEILQSVQPLGTPTFVDGGVTAQKRPLANIRCDNNIC